MYVQSMVPSKLTGFWILLQIFSGAQSRVGESKGSYEKPIKECPLLDGTVLKCESGACCDNECCPFYYQLWWFWMIWALTIMMSCCCAYHHRRKQRMNRLDINHNHPAIPSQDNYVGGSNYPGPPIDNNSLGYAKLPPYNDVVRIPPTSSPPPPYSSRKKPVHAIACLEPTDNGETVLTIVPCEVTSSMLSLASLSHYIPDILSKANIKTIKDTFKGRTTVAANIDDVTASLTSLETCESLKSSGSVKSFSKRLKRSLKSSLLSVKERRHDDVIDDDNDDDDMSSISSSEEMLNGSYLWMSGGSDPNNNNHQLESRGDFLLIRGDDHESIMESLTSLATINESSMIRHNNNKPKLDTGNGEDADNNNNSTTTDPNNNNIQQMKVNDNPTSEITDLIEDPQTYNESISSANNTTTTTSSKSLQKQMSRASLQHPAFP